jgi:large subunit ribosomal protein L23
MITPIYTEKSLKQAKEGQYTFLVGRNAVKTSLKSEISKLFGVHVIDIKTIKVSGEQKRNAKGNKISVLANKKAIVTLKEGEKLDIFEEGKK